MTLTWWKNIPFFLVWGPLLLSSVTAVLPPKAARGMMLAIPLLGTAGATALLCRIGGLTGESFLYSLGEFGAPVGNEFRIGPMEALLAIVFLMILFLSVLGGFTQLKAQIPERRQSLYAVMVMLLTAALMAEVFTNDVFTGYVFLEIMTIAACALILARDRGRALYAATRYMIMNLIGSGLFLMGISMLYSLTGQLLMSDIRRQIDEILRQGVYTRALVLSGALITIGLAIKAALYPFHTWLPDAYANATPASSAMLSSLISKAYIFLYVKIIVRAFGLEAFGATGIRNVLFVCAVAGIIMGSVDALKEIRLRRMIAYSSVAQIGYIYLGISIGTEAGIAAALLHMIAHALAKSMLFLSADRLAVASGGQDDFEALRGAGFRAKTAGACYVIGACSIVGIPVLAGFSSKLYLASACMGMDTGRCLAALIVLAISTLLNAGYFLVSIVTLYSKSERAHEPEKRDYAAGTAVALLAAAVVAAGLSAGFLMQMIVHGVSVMM